MSKGNFDTDYCVNFVGDRFADKNILTNLRECGGSSLIGTVQEGVAEKSLYEGNYGNVAYTD